MNNIQEQTQPTQPTQPNNDDKNNNIALQLQNENLDSEVLIRLIGTRGIQKTIDLSNDTTKNEWIFGRNSKADVSFGVKIPRLSGSHFKIWYKNPKDVLIQDLSTNGTYLNGKRLQKNTNYLLQMGDEISVGVGVPQDTLLFIVVYPPQRDSAKGILPNSDITTKIPLNDTVRAEKEDIDFQRILNINEKYIIKNEVVGQGAFALVKKAIERNTGDTYAVKVISKRKLGAGNRQSVLREIDILLKLNHPYITTLKDHFEDESFFYLVMEFVPGGDLMDYVAAQGSIQEDAAREILRQTLKAINYIHDLDILHRDLKPDNILIAQDDPIVIKLSDFGLAKITPSVSTNKNSTDPLADEEDLKPGTLLKTFCGTLAYLAPEIINGKLSSKIKKNRRSYSSLVDMWSLGCLCYVILTGHLPFSGKTQDQLFNRIKQGAYHDAPLREYNISENAKDFINCLLQTDPSLRLSASDALTHPWILEGESVISKQLSSQIPKSSNLNSDSSSDEEHNVINGGLVEAKTESGKNTVFTDEASKFFDDKIAVNWNKMIDAEKNMQVQRLCEQNAAAMKGTSNDQTGKPEFSDSKIKRPTGSITVKGDTTESFKKFQSQLAEKFANPDPNGNVFMNSMACEQVDNIPPGTLMTFFPLKHSLLKEKVIHIPQTNKPFMFGRNNGTNYIIRDARISKLHCTIMRKRHPIVGNSFFESPAQGLDDIWLVDYSSNGCHINGKKIGKGKKALLKNNDQILLFLDFKKKEFLGFKVVINDNTGLFIDRSDKLLVMSTSSNEDTKSKQQLLKIVFNKITIEKQDDMDQIVGSKKRKAILEETQNYQVKKRASLKLT